MKWTVGPEHEDTLYENLGEALQKQGFDLTDKWFGMAGSQDISRWIVKSNEGRLTIESETYIGLTVKGSKILIEKVKNEFNKL